MRLLISALNFDDLVRPPVATLCLDDHPRPLTIARGAEGESLGFPTPDELHVPDRFLSTRHALLVSENGNDVIRDLESRNGTWVDGERVSEKALEDGALLEIGHTLFCYRNTELPVDDQVKLGPVRTLCPELHALMRDLERVAPTREPVLIVGESGSGKELVAEVVHRLSGRKGELCPVDCGAVPEGLFEATLFGEVARAEGGTLFLDEAGTLSPEAQQKLLGRISEGDVRWVAAITHELPSVGEELLSRLAGGFVARVPPLRKRREDLGLLTAHFLNQSGVLKANMTVPAARQLYCGPLEGNVRELRQTIRTASLLAVGDTICPEHLPADSAREEPDTRKLAPGKGEVEAALQVTEGNAVRAAKRLGTTVRQLSSWIEKFQVDLRKFR